MKRKEEQSNTSLIMSAIQKEIHEKFPNLRCSYVPSIVPMLTISKDFRVVASIAIGVVENNIIDIDNSFVNYDDVYDIVDDEIQFETVENGKILKTEKIPCKSPRHRHKVIKSISIDLGDPDSFNEVINAIHEFIDIYNKNYPD